MAAVTNAQWDGSSITLLEKVSCPTDLSVLAEAMIVRLIAFANGILTEKTGGMLKECSDICMTVPETETYKVQELHLPVYHYLCAAVEDDFFN